MGCRSAWMDHLQFEMLPHRGRAPLEVVVQTGPSLGWQVAENYLKRGSQQFSDLGKPDTLSFNKPEKHFQLGMTR